MEYTLKQRVLSLEQDKIYSIYFGIGTEHINWSTISGRNKLNNPLRDDYNGSLTFKWFGDRLFARDWGDFNYNGDVFKVVGFILGKNSNNPNDFVDICENILESYRKNKVILSSKRKVKLLESFSDITKIEIRARNLSNYDYKTYNKFGICNKQVDKYVTAVHRFYINDIQTGYKFSNLDPCYKYVVNRDFTKLYFPYRKKQSGNPRFITNNILTLDDINTIRHCDDIILCKSIKDKMLLEQFIDKLSIKSIDIKVLSSESNILQDPIVKILNKYAKRNIFTMSDIDDVGIKQMNQFKDTYGYIPLYFNTNAKDPTDYVMKFGYEKGLQSFKENITFILSNRNKRQIL